MIIEDQRRFLEEFFVESAKKAGISIRPESYVHDIYFFDRLYSERFQSREINIDFDEEGAADVEGFLSEYGDPATTLLTIKASNIANNIDRLWTIYFEWRTIGLVPDDFM